MISNVAKTVIRFSLERILSFENSLLGLEIAEKGFLGE
jgi:hypothetical protein